MSSDINRFNDALVKGLGEATNGEYAEAITLIDFLLWMERQGTVSISKDDAYKAVADYLVDDRKCRMLQVQSRRKKTKA
jgi:hypothetical protein